MIHTFLGLVIEIINQQGNLDQEHNESYRKTKVSPAVKISGHFTVKKDLYLILIVSFLLAKWFLSLFFIHSQTV